MGSSGCGGSVKGPPPTNEVLIPTSDASTFTGMDSDDQQPPENENPGTNECLTHEDCESGHCTMLADGSICSPLCSQDADCPDGLICLLDDTAYGPALACVYPSMNACRPCAENADCTGLAGEELVCELIGGFGACLPTCTQDTDCPPWFSCTENETSNTKTCLPNNGTCSCPAQYLGATGTCAKTNEYGTCTGSYTCSAQGKSDCSAPEATEDGCFPGNQDCLGSEDQPADPEAPCGACGGLCPIGDGPSWDNPFSLDESNSSGVSLNDEGYIVLNAEDVDTSYIWIANSGENTVSKLDTTDGCEVARYHTCPDPSRTAVDLYGNGIITCRGNGGVMKIAAVASYCIDKNNDGLIQTTVDSNNDCSVQAEEMLSISEDECVLWNVQPDSTTGDGGLARAAGVDHENHIWVGYWSSKRLRRLEPTAGNVVHTIDLEERPYGIAIDGDGIIWVASRDPHPHRLAKVHPVDGRLNAWASPAGHMYGVGIDPYGKVWVATGEGQGLARFDPLSETWMNWSWGGRGYTRGVVALMLTNPDGSLAGSTVYAAHNTFNCQGDSSSRLVSVVDAASLEDLPAIDLGLYRGPVGVSIDRTGNLWTVNMCENGSQWEGSASKVDTETGQVIGTYSVGNMPYTYSDMTGYVLGTITAPQGSYRHIFDAPSLRDYEWLRIEIEAVFPADATTWITVRVRAANTNEELATTPWSETFGPYPPQAFPVDLTAANIVGTLMEVELVLHTQTTGASPIVKTIVAVAKPAGQNL
ncbi:MAG: hypothetical protein CMH54_06940 [Myxococcales bacterium]|nr:hypothetical protein [Myxococcales bacterium]